jgi:hypothetical protein
VVQLCQENEKLFLSLTSSPPPPLCIHQEWESACQRLGIVFGP